MITPEQAKYHPQSNIITRALGTDACPTPDLYDGEIQAGDRSSCWRPTVSPTWSARSTCSPGPASRMIPSVRGPGW